MAAPAPRTSLVFALNGEKIVVENPDPAATLNDYLRESCRFTGTKIGCGEGGCGACAVLVAELVGGDTVKHATANSCLRPLCSLDGVAITTTEGLGSKSSGNLHPVQERIAAFNGSQCGFCTPGMVVSVSACLRRAHDDGGRAPTAAELEASLDGNLCRCTGYRPILDAAKSFAGDQGCVPAAPCTKPSTATRRVRPQTSATSSRA